MPSRIRRIVAANARQARMWGNGYRKIQTSVYSAEKVKSVTLMKKQPDWVKREGKKMYRVELTRKKLPAGMRKKGYHTHWFVSRKHNVRRLHPIGMKHRDSESQLRHDRQTGKYQRWLKKHKLHMVDSSRDRYIREVLKSRR